ncbi:MAG: hypothetical protein ACI8XC_003394 [Gammaproteobacteria bacterium]|jgi:hypothetical protein
MVLSDKTVWSLNELISPTPDDPKSGDKIEIQYESDEDGVTKINRITILSK